MKKLATLMFALAFVGGTVIPAFSQEPPPKEEKKKKKKKSKKDKDADKEKKDKTG